MLEAEAATKVVVHVEEALVELGTKLEGAPEMLEERVGGACDWLAPTARGISRRVSEEGEAIDRDLAGRELKRTDDVGEFTKYATWRGRFNGGV
jgi:hypothetical protein